MKYSEFKKNLLKDNKRLAKEYKKKDLSWSFQKAIAETRIFISKVIEK